MLKNRTVQFLFFKYLFISFLVTILIIPAICLADADRIFKENSKAVVVVVTYDEKGNPISQGSGFIVRADGGVVTNYHVISNAKGIKVRTGDKVLETEGLIYVDKENDLVILKVKGKNLPTVKLGDIEKADIGEKVYVISSPKGLENTISEGILSGIREIDPKRKIIQITAPISQGSSGGPVFNKNGEVIGIATFLIKEAQNINFAMPANLIKEKISATKVMALKDTVIEDYKKSAEYWFVLGYYYGEAGMYKESIDSYKEAIRFKPDFAEAHYNLGLVYGRDLGMYKEAVEAFKQAIRIKPDYAEAHYSLGVAYLDLGMYKEAMEANKQARRIKPDYAVAHYNLGVAYGSLGMYKEEVEANKQAIRIKPDYAEAHYNLGFSYGNLGMYREAIESYKQAIRIKPDFADAHVNLGVTYGNLGMHREAIEAYKQAIRIKPDDAIAHYNLGVTYDNLGMQREALEAYKQAIRIKPDYAVAHYNLGVAYGELGKYRKEMEAYKQAIRIKPDYALAHYGLGISYLILNDRGSALYEYKILKNLDSELANKLFNVIYK